MEQITIDLHKNPSLPSYSLSIQLYYKDTYNKPIAGTDFTIRYVYEYSDFNIFTEWGAWLETNEHQPTGNPCGQVR